MKHLIAIVDEGKHNLKAFGEFLSRENFEVKMLGSSEELVDGFEEHVPDVLILPVELTPTNGIDLCYQIKNQSKTSNVFIILLNDRKEEFSHIAGLESGADDYLSVFVQERVLLCRIKALLKRKKWSSFYTSDQRLIIDQERYLIIKEGAEIYLPKKEFEILSLLYTRPNKVFSREEIKNKIWTNFEEVRGRTVDVHVRNIREKLGSHLIKTIKGVGYSLEI